MRSSTSSPMSSCQATSSPSTTPSRTRPAALADPQHPVDDDRHEELGDEVGVTVGVRHHPRREAGEAGTDGRCQGVHRQPPPEQPVPGGCREREPQQLDDEEGHRGPGEQGQRCEGQPQPEHGGVRHEVDAGREVLEVAEEGVGQRREVVGRRAEVPLERLLVLHALGQVAGAHVGDEPGEHPQPEQEVRDRREQVGTAKGEGLSGSRVVVTAGCRTGSGGRLVLHVGDAGRTRPVVDGPGRVVPR